MLVVNTKEIFLLNLHQNRVHFPAEGNAFVLDHQHGRRDVKPAMKGCSAGVLKPGLCGVYQREASIMIKFHLRNIVSITSTSLNAIQLISLSK